jgi:hypothetical protein
MDLYNAHYKVEDFPKFFLWSLTLDFHLKAIDRPKR